MHLYGSWLPRKSRIQGCHGDRSGLTANSSAGRNVPWVARGTGRALASTLNCRPVLLAPVIPATRHTHLPTETSPRVAMGTGRASRQTHLPEETYPGLPWGQVGPSSLPRIADLSCLRRSSRLHGTPTSRQKRLPGLPWGQVGPHGKLICRKKRTLGCQGDRSGPRLNSELPTCPHTAKPTCPHTLFPAPEENPSRPAQAKRAFGSARRSEGPDPKVQLRGFCLKTLGCAHSAGSGRWRPVCPPRRSSRRP